jgi:cyclophilin family peptidyl-prolyl cis-trans isomerase
MFVLNVNAQLFTPEEIEILKYQDLRTTGPNGELLTYLNAHNNAVVIRTLIALGNIGDKENVRVIAEQLMSNNNPDIRMAAAFALSLIPCEETVKNLSEALKTETDEIVIAKIINALGFTGNTDQLQDVCAYDASTPNLKSAVALSIARFGRRNIKNAVAVETLTTLVKSGDENVQRFCAYAFANQRNRDLLLPAKDELLALTQSKNADARMWAFLAYGYTAGVNELKYFQDAYEKETVWQVKVNILNSFQTMFRFNKELANNKTLALFLVDKGEGEDVYLSTTALKVLGAVFQNSTDENLLIELKPRLQWFMIKGKAVELATIGEAVNTLGMIFRDEAKDDLIQRYTDAEGYYLKPYLISAFKYMKNAGVYKDLRKLITDDVQNYVNKNKISEGDMIAGKELAPIYKAFVETLDELKKSGNADDREIMRLIFSEFVSSKDPSIVDVCINALNDSLYADKRTETATILTLDYPDLVYPKDKETMKLFIREFGELKSDTAVGLLENNLKLNDYEICKESADALKKITGKDYTFNAKKVSFFNSDNLNGLLKKQFATLKTTRGDIKIKLYPYLSPFTVLNFVKLSEKGFYNGTTFHRVIPNFVIQGGDPLNSGWGGPEYTIRSEFIPASFERGIVGMASDGKDTEGSQFFVMHSAFYHLDNAYTIFGEVVSGIENVDKIYIDDILESVVITEN